MLKTILEQALDVGDYALPPHTTPAEEKEKVVTLCKGVVRNTRSHDHLVEHITKMISYDDGSERYALTCFP